MISGEQRRKVAQALRMLPTDMPEEISKWERDGMFINTNDSDEADYSQVHDVIMGCFPAEHTHPGDYEELHRTLADLIDRPTCKFKPAYGPDLMGKVSLVECTACAWTIEPWIAYEFRYCPNCGAEVIDD